MTGGGLKDDANQLAGGQKTNQPCKRGSRKGAKSRRKEEVLFFAPLRETV
jgi:hypothetical protein